MADIDDNLKKITGQKRVNPNQVKVVNIPLMVSEIFTRKTKKLMENNECELYVFESESDHSDEQKESNIARQGFAEQPNKKSNEQPDTTDMHDLESEESAAQGSEQKVKGLKILTPSQMLNRLPIFFAQLNAGNNSKKLKNEIRQLLYSL